MYKCFMSLKQQDGSFLVTKHGEVDVRYAPNYAVGKLCHILVLQRHLLSNSNSYTIGYSHSGARGRNS